MGRFISKKDLFCNKVEKSHISMCKKILRINKIVNDIEVLAEVSRVPF